MPHPSDAWLPHPATPANATTSTTASDSTSSATTGAAASSATTVPMAAFEVALRAATAHLDDEHAKIVRATAFQGLSNASVRECFQTTVAPLLEKRESGARQPEVGSGESEVGDDGDGKGCGEGWRASRGRGDVLVDSLLRLHRALPELEVEQLNEARTALRLESLAQAPVPAARRLELLQWLVGGTLHAALAQVGEPLTALVAQRDGVTTQAALAAAADVLVRRMLHGLTIEAGRAGQPGSMRGDAWALSEPEARGQAREKELARLQAALRESRANLLERDAAVAARDAMIAERDATIRRLEAGLSEAGDAARRAQAAVEAQDRLYRELDRLRGPDAVVSLQGANGGSEGVGAFPSESTLFEKGGCAPASAFSAQISPRPAPISMAALSTPAPASAAAALYPAASTRAVWSPTAAEPMKVEECALVHVQTAALPREERVGTVEAGEQAALRFCEVQICKESGGFVVKLTRL